MLHSLHPVSPLQRPDNLFEKHLRHDGGHGVSNLLPHPHVTELVLEREPLQAGDLAECECAFTGGMVACACGTGDCVPEGETGVVRRMGELRELERAVVRGVLGDVDDCLGDCGIGLQAWVTREIGRFAVSWRRELWEGFSWTEGSLVGEISDIQTRERMNRTRTRRRSNGDGAVEDRSRRG